MVDKLVAEGAKLSLHKISLRLGLAPNSVFARARQNAGFKNRLDAKIAASNGKA